MMNKFVVSAVVSLGLLLPFGSAVQAGEFDRNDVARALLGVAAVAIIAKAIDDRNDRKDAARSRSSHHAGSGFNEFVNGSASGVRVIDGRIRDGRIVSPASRAHRGFKQLPLPASCNVIVETRYGDRAAYSRSCLDRHYKFASKLPGACETLVRTPRGYRAVYGARCLDRDGWKVALR